MKLAFSGDSGGGGGSCFYPAIHSILQSLVEGVFSRENFSVNSTDFQKHEGWLGQLRCIVSCKVILETREPLQQRTISPAYTPVFQNRIEPMPCHAINFLRVIPPYILYAVLFTTSLSAAFLLFFSLVCKNDNNSFREREKRGTLVGSPPVSFYIYLGDVLKSNYHHRHQHHNHDTSSTTTAGTGRNIFNII